MATDRGILYIVWGDKMEPLLARSMASVRRFYPEMPIHIVRENPERPDLALMLKTKMGRLTPFKSTLYLDVDTVVLANLDDAFERAERFGLACCICECPWTRRYYPIPRDGIEYNTGVLFFAEPAKEVFALWERLAEITPSVGQWLMTQNQPRGMPFDDQASFARAVHEHQFNPCVLPINYNLRPSHNRRFFAPLKIWHDYREIPPDFHKLNDACESGQRLVTFVDIGGA